MRTKKTGPWASSLYKGKKLGHFLFYLLKSEKEIDRIWRANSILAHTLTEIVTLRTHRPSQSSRTKESPRASSSFPPPWYPDSERQPNSFSKADCGFFFCTLLSTDKTLKRYIPQSRGEVVVWALSPSGSDLVRPLPLQHSEEAKTASSVMAKTWFLIPFVL